MMLPATNSEVARVAMDSMIQVSDGMEVDQYEWRSKENTSDLLPLSVTPDCVNPTTMDGNSPIASHPSISIITPVDNVPSSSEPNINVSTVNEDLDVGESPH